ncbi:unnamed protein product [Caenorhabditis bovis]|uniref:Globin domain-containing protein n=1 Tax=Caenorhabditis bovis TaxID=2654633 RepID=A0A8S1E6B2_9PELO|nr:unnamed protein product [Caenorhabditis bovis]
MAPKWEETAPLMTGNLDFAHALHYEPRYKAKIFVVLALLLDFWLHCHVLCKCLIFLISVDNMYRRMFEYIDLANVNNTVRNKVEPENRRSTIGNLDVNKIKVAQRREESSKCSVVVQQSKEPMKIDKQRNSIGKENNEPQMCHLKQIAAETSRLSERQREILRTTFINIEKDAVKNGLKIFVKLFSEYPRYKLIWAQFRVVPESSLMNAVELRRHASIYIKGLGTIIESMRDEEELTKQLTRIAVAHIKWNVQRNHVIHMIEPVLDVVKECNGYQLDEHTKEAWITLYQVIANFIEVFRNKALTN